MWVCGRACSVIVRVQLCVSLSWWLMRSRPAHASAAPRARWESIRIGFPICPLPPSARSQRSGRRSWVVSNRAWALPWRRLRIERDQQAMPPRGGRPMRPHWLPLLLLLVTHAASFKLPNPSDAPQFGGLRDEVSKAPQSGGLGVEQSEDDVRVTIQSATESPEGRRQLFPWPIYFGVACLADNYIPGFDCDGGPPPPPGFCDSWDTSSGGGSSYYFNEGRGWTCNSCCVSDCNSDCDHTCVRRAEWNPGFSAACPLDSRARVPLASGPRLPLQLRQQVCIQLRP